jgi:hypothetical protein
LSLLLPRQFFVRFMELYPNITLKIRSFDGGGGGLSKKNVGAYYPSGIRQRICGLDGV